jgi:hypothetical protein
MPPARKVPQDHKTAGDDAFFHWTSDSNVRIKLPKMASLGTGAIRRHRNKEGLDMLFSILEEVMTGPELDELDALPLAETNRMFQAWQDETGATIPQS